MLWQSYIPFWGLQRRIYFFTIFRLVKGLISFYLVLKDYTSSLLSTGTSLLGQLVIHLVTTTKKFPALDTSSLEFSFYRSSHSFGSLLLKYFADQPLLNSILHFSGPIICFSWHFIPKTFQYIYLCVFFLCYYIVSSLRTGSFCSLFLSPFPRTMPDNRRQVFKDIF